VRFVRLGRGLFGERLARPFTERRAVAVHRADPRRPDATTVLSHQRCRRAPACLPRTISGLVLIGGRHSLPFITPCSTIFNGSRLPGFVSTHGLRKLSHSIS
jgi:hypothetical protein